MRIGLVMVILFLPCGCSSPQGGVAPPTKPTGAAAATTVATTAMATTAVVVPFEMGNVGFAPGDLVTVTSVKGTRAKFDVGGTYTIEGTWKLDSHDVAVLALYSTNGTLAGTQSTNVTRGSGTFSFTTTIVSEGYLHVSYYPADHGSSFGGAYFGTGKSLYRGWYVPGEP